MSVFVREERRSLGWADVWGGEPASLGALGVTRIAPVFASVSLIADQFSSVPLRVVEDSPDGQTVTVPTPLFLSDPDPFISPMDWTYQLVVSLKLRGNAYGLVDPEHRYVRWLHPDWVTVDESVPMRVRYWVLGQPVQPVKRGGTLLHVREFINPGYVVGLSPIEQFMNTFDVADAAANYGRRWFKNAAVPPAILSTTTPRATAQSLREARDDFIAAANEGKPVALPGEWTWQKVGIAPAEAQFLETIQASATTIASIFRVPAEDIGGAAGSSRTYKNRESDQVLLNVRTLMPLGRRLGLALGDLLPERQRVEFALETLAQPGALENAQIDTQELENGTSTVDEIRVRRGKQPRTQEQIDQWFSWFRTRNTRTEAIKPPVGKATE